MCRSQLCDESIINGYSATPRWKHIPFGSQTVRIIENVNKKTRSFLQIHWRWQFVIKLVCKKSHCPFSWVFLHDYITMYLSKSKSSCNEIGKSKSIQNFPCALLVVKHERARKIFKHNFLSSSSNLNVYFSFPLFVLSFHFESEKISKTVYRIRIPTVNVDIIYAMHTHQKILDHSILKLVQWYDLECRDFLSKYTLSKVS